MSKDTSKMNLMTRVRKIFGFFFFRNERGQSTVEYLIVTGAVVFFIIGSPKFYDEMSHIMQNKYKSYSFGVAISDPPRKKFDDDVNVITGKIKQVLDFIKDIIFPPGTGLFHMPTWKDLKDILNKILHVF